MAVQDPNLHIVGPSLEAEPYGIGINKSRTIWYARSMPRWKRIRRDAIVGCSLYRKWASPFLGPALSPPEPKYRD